MFLLFIDKLLGRDSGEERFDKQACWEKHLWMHILKNWKFQSYTWFRHRM